MDSLPGALQDMGWQTADGLPVSREPPFGVTVVVSRTCHGRTEYLLLHRAHEGPGYEGDWAWGPPAGARMPGEATEECARRELLEETGLALEPGPVALDGAGWALFAAAAPEGAEIRLSPEHDRYEWLPLDDAARRCLPAQVREQLRAAAGAR